MSDEERCGWGFPSNSRKAHYFQGLISVCRKWMFSGDLTPEDGKRSPDDCAACLRIVAKKVTPTP